MAWNGHDGAKKNGEKEILKEDLLKFAYLVLFNLSLPLRCNAPISRNISNGLHETHMNKCIVAKTSSVVHSLKGGGIQYGQALCFKKCLQPKSTNKKNDVNSEDGWG